MKIARHLEKISNKYVFRMLYCSSLVVLLTACITSNTSIKNTLTPTQGPSGVAIQCSAHSSNPVTLNMYYGSEKEAWMKDVIADFNSHHITACDGPITVQATPIGSGESMQEIVDGEIQPDIWSPAGSVWLKLINDRWRAKNGVDIIGTGATDAPSLVISPVVIAMWKPEAEALGWPNKPIGWADIAALSTNPKGWAAFGHPEFGDFKFGHTRPNDSNSGLDAIIAENYAALGKVRNLTVEDVNNPATKDFITNVESSIVAYGDSTGFFATKMFTNGPGYLSAAVMYESLVVEANDGKTYPHLPFPVVAIYPKEGTFYSDHPFVILNAKWVTSAKRTSALAFRNFLLAPAQQKKALQYGFRPADLNLPVRAPIDSAHGVDTKQPNTLLQVPTADVVNAIESSWLQTKRKVDVMLILDRSGSMNDLIGGVGKVDAAKKGLTEFVNLLGNSDGLGLTVFSNNANVLTQVSALGAKRQNILNLINQITASGNTLLFDTIYAQFDALHALPSKNNKVLIVLTDGMDNISQHTLNQLISKITPAPENVGSAIKVYTIAYGNDADVSALKQIAHATGVQEYAGTPQNIKTIYLQISTYL